MGKIVIGSKPKVTISAIAGLPAGVHLTDENVDVSASFYGSEYPTKTVVIEKDQMSAEGEEQSDSLFCMVDTTELGSGVLSAEVTISYPIEGAEENAVQKIQLIVNDESGKTTLIKSVVA